MRPAATIGQARGRRFKGPGDWSWHMGLTIDWSRRCHRENGAANIVATSNTAATTTTHVEQFPAQQTPAVQRDDRLVAKHAATVEEAAAWEPVCITLCPKCSSKRLKRPCNRTTHLNHKASTVSKLPHNQRMCKAASMLNTSGLQSNVLTGKSVRLGRR